MKKVLLALIIILSSFTAQATIHTVSVWDGYFQFLTADITIELGDTVQWIPLDTPMMVHTITSTNIPFGAEAFDQIWQAPADTFFQYVPQLVGLYEYECTPHALSYGMIGSIEVLGAVNTIDEEAAVAALIVYPNPTTDRIQFNTSTAIYPFRIVSNEGKLLLRGRTDEIVNVSTLANGVYHIEIVADKPRVIPFLKE